MIDGHKVLHTSTNRKAFWFWKDYERSTDTTVLQAYRTKPSEEKQSAEISIKMQMVQVNGHGYKVMSHSSFVFTCGYLIPAPQFGGEVLKVHTRDNVYFIVNDGEYISK